jgi:hypothetical protein
VWAYPTDGGAPRWVGVAAHGGLRPDVATAMGSRFLQSGFTIEVADLPEGTWVLVVYAHSVATGDFVTASTVTVNVVE